MPRPEDYVIETGPMGPIGEGQALILRVNRNCPWNKCLFCPVYKGKKFSTRTVQEIKGDIDVIHRIQDLLEKTSWKIGLNGRMKREVIQAAVSRHPEIYGVYPARMTQEQRAALQTLNNVANWLLNGAKRVFLQDANALAMRPEGLTQVLHDLKDLFPTVHTITCYARSKTCQRRSVEELRALKEAGLSWCFVGIESGCDKILDHMKKGVTMKEHIEGGQKVMAAGLHMAAFVMPGLSGKDKGRAQKHITDTIAVLNKIQPTEVRVRSLAVLEGTPLFRMWESGEFSVAEEGQLIEELRMLYEGLTFDCTFETLQMTNPLFTFKGRLSQIKEAMQAGIDWFRALSRIEKARFLLERYVDDGYLDYVKAWGKYDPHLQNLIESARNSLAEEAEDAVEKTGRAILAIKSKGVP